MSYIKVKSWSLYLAEWPGAMLCNGLHVFMCCTCQETDVNTVSLDSGGLPEVCKNISTTVQMSTTARHDHLIPHVHTHLPTHTHRSSNERNEDKTGYLKRCSTPTSSASSAPISLGTWSNVLVVGEPSWNITFTVTQWVSQCITMSCQPDRSHSGRWSIPQDSVTHVMCRLRTHAQTKNDIEMMYMVKYQRCTQKQTTIKSRSDSMNSTFGIVLFQQQEWDNFLWQNTPTKHEQSAAWEYLHRAPPPQRCRPQWADPGPLASHRSQPVPGNSRNITNISLPTQYQTKTVQKHSYLTTAQIPPTCHIHTEYLTKTAQIPPTHHFYTEYLTKTAQIPPTYHFHTQYLTETAQIPPTHHFHTEYLTKTAQIPPTYHFHTQYLTETAQIPPTHHFHTEYLTKTAQIPPTYHFHIQYLTKTYHTWQWDELHSHTWYTTKTAQIPPAHSTWQ